MRNKILEKKAIKWVNTYYECADYIILNCSKEETNESYDVLIDKEDFDLVSQGQWFVFNKRKNSHLKDICSIVWTRKIDEKQYNYDIYQLILSTKNNKDIVVDHINNNRFDNRKSNLRLVDAKTNRINQPPKQTSNNKFINGRQGYNFDKNTNKYLTRININGKEINIGRYNTELEAEIINIKANMIIGNHNISLYLKNRIKELNIILDEEEVKSNKYLYKVYCIYNGIEFPKKLNGKLNLDYIKNINTIIQLHKENKSWLFIEKYLINNYLQKTCKGSTCKKYYEKYINGELVGLI